MPSPNAGAEFLYPSVSLPNDYVQYNYKDTVNVDWVEYKANSSQTTLQIWYWMSSFPNAQWQALDLNIVPVNGTMSFQLDGVTDHSTGWYLGQWNLNFTREDNSPKTGLTLSKSFNCTFDDSKDAQTYGLSSSAGATSTSDSTVPTATSATTPAQNTIVTVTATPSSDSQAGASVSSSSPSSSTATPAPSAGVSGASIAGIIIGVILLIALIGAGAWFIRRKQSRRAPSSVMAFHGAPPFQYTPTGYPPHAYPASAYPQAGYAYHDHKEAPLSSSDMYKKYPPIPSMGPHRTHRSLSYGKGYVALNELPAEHPGQVQRSLPQGGNSSVRHEMPAEVYR